MNFHKNVLIAICDCSLWCDEIYRFSVYAVILKDFILYKYIYTWIVGFWNALCKTDWE